jgi:hypothetical protein
MQTIVLAFYTWDDFWIVALFYIMYQYDRLREVDLLQTLSH